MRDRGQQPNPDLPWFKVRAVELFLAVLIIVALFHQSALAESSKSQDIKVLQLLYDTIDDATRRADTKKLASILADN
jgi:hypothetical protein